MLETFLIGIGLSMDALGVSIALGVVKKSTITPIKIAGYALLFGFFQAAMPLIGCRLALMAAEHISRYGKIVACILLLFIGVKMIIDRNKQEEVSGGIITTLMLAVATSIDALFTGIGFGCLGGLNIYRDIAIIGCTTTVISAGGCITGYMAGRISGSKAMIAGGIILMTLGVKILLT